MNHNSHVTGGNRRNKKLATYAAFRFLIHNDIPFGRDSKTQSNGKSDLVPSPSNSFVRTLSSDSFVRTFGKLAWAPRSFSPSRVKDLILCFFGLLASKVQ